MTAIPHSISCHSKVNIHITKNGSESKTHTQARIKLKVSIVNSIGCLSYVYSITCDLYRAIKRLSSIDGLNQIDSARPVKKEGGRSPPELKLFDTHQSIHLPKGSATIRKVVMFERILSMVSGYFNKVVNLNVVSEGTKLSLCLAKQSSKAWCMRLSF